MVNKINQLKNVDIVYILQVHCVRKYIFICFLEFPPDMITIISCICNQSKLNDISPVIGLAYKY